VSSARGSYSCPVDSLEALRPSALAARVKQETTNSQDHTEVTMTQRNCSTSSSRLHARDYQKLESEKWHYPLAAAFAFAALAMMPATARAQSSSVVVPQS
jgi:hypothetical protein